MLMILFAIFELQRWFQKLSAPAGLMPVGGLITGFFGGLTLDLALGVLLRTPPGQCVELSDASAASPSPSASGRNHDREAGPQPVRPALERHGNGVPRSLGKVAPEIVARVARVAVPATLFAALGSLALLLCVRYDAPAWTLFAAYAATATTPNTGGMSRARWAHLLKGDPGSLHTANSFEQAADELCFMLGPVLAAFLCGTFFPEAGTLVGTVLLVTGVLVFAAQRATEPPPRGHKAGKSPLRAPGMPSLLAVCLAMGAVFGSTEVVTIAFADTSGHRTAAGVVLALQAAGSCAAGLLYGRLRLSGPAEYRYPWCIAAMTALLTLPLLAATLTGSLALLALALLTAGMATAPTMITNMAMVQQRTPPTRLNEGMTLAVTALLGGIATGSAIGGWTAEHLTPAAAYGVPLTAAAVALLVALAATP